jgi:tRNA-splicing ligase RtcB (3'-phosphate/5'-hydroxy nucleic acid ligase)
VSISRIQGKTVEARLWVPAEEVESKALDQLRNIASLPWVAHVAVMPDVHFGIGATVGAVIGMLGAVSPAAVGVDIGCGMGAMRTSLTASDLPDTLAGIRSAIEKAIPVGLAAHAKPAIGQSGPPPALRDSVGELFAGFDALDPGVRDLRQRAEHQLGTLGGGNHFIELCLDTEQRVWLLLHSGSRNIGKSLAELHMEVARGLGHNVGLPDRDLAVFLAGTPEMKAYRRDLFWAQRYALLNRQVMFALYQGVIRGFFPQAAFDPPVLCHHNYVAEEVHGGEDLMVTRKGAISARAGELGIIPGSMGTRSFVVKGKGNPESLTSASHGAGRRMSRGEAKRRFKVEDLRQQTTGVECRKDAGVLDEIPGAYKDIDRVMAFQADLVEVVAELRQVLCVKG